MTVRFLGRTPIPPNLIGTSVIDRVTSSDKGQVVGSSPAVAATLFLVGKVSRSSVGRAAMYSIE